jgi:hypothetical protein
VRFNEYTPAESISSTNWFRAAPARSKRIAARRAADESEPEEELKSEAEFKSGALAANSGATRVVSLGVSELPADPVEIMLVELTAARLAAALSELRAIVMFHSEEDTEGVTFVPSAKSKTTLVFPL